MTSIRPYFICSERPPLQLDQSKPLILTETPTHPHVGPTELDAFSPVAFQLSGTGSLDRSISIPFFFSSTTVHLTLRVSPARRLRSSLLTANSGSSEADRSDRSGRPIRPDWSVQSE